MPRSKYVRFVTRAGTSALNYAAYRAGTGAVKGAWKLASGMLKRARSRKSSGTTLTQQNNSAVLNSSKRVPRRWRKFINRVNKAVQSTAPRAVYTSLSKGSTTGAVDLQQYSGAFFADLNTTAVGDIWNVFKDAYTLASVAAAESRKVYINKVTSQFQITPSANAQIDVYLCVARRDINDAGTPSDQFGEYFSDMVAVGTVGTDDPATTPFMVPNWCRYYKILKTYKFDCTANEAVRMEHSFKVNRYIQGKVLQDQTIMKGLTHCWLYRVRGIPGSTAGTAGLLAASSNWSIQTRINYQTVVGLTQDVVGQTK